MDFIAWIFERTTITNGELALSITMAISFELLIAYLIARKFLFHRTLFLFAKKKIPNAQYSHNNEDYQKQPK